MLLYNHQWSGCVVDLLTTYSSNFVPSWGLGLWNFAAESASLLLFSFCLLTPSGSRVLSSKGIQMSLWCWCLPLQMSHPRTAGRLFLQRVWSHLDLPTWHLGPSVQYLPCWPWEPLSKTRHSFLVVPSASGLDTRRSRDQWYRRLAEHPRLHDSDQPRWNDNALSRRCPRSERRLSFLRQSLGHVTWQSWSRTPRLWWALGQWRLPCSTSGVCWIYPHRCGHSVLFYSLSRSAYFCAGWASPYKQIESWNRSPRRIGEKVQS